MKLSNKLKLKLIIPLIVVFVGLMISGCENSPTDLGQQYLKGDDTLFTKILDSEIDTMNINARSVLHYVNTYASSRVLVGSYQGYSSFGFLKFIDIPAGYDSCTVLSATLQLNTANYSFYDSVGTTAFNLYEVIDTVQYDTISYNGYSNALIGSTVLGNYTGTPQFNGRISVPMDTGVVRRWLFKAANSNYSFDNNGIAYIPQSASTIIKGFYNYFTGVDSVKPKITAIVSLNSEIDTLTFTYSENVNFTTYNGAAIPADRFVVQPGLSFWSVLNFNLSKLPQNITINEAQLSLTLDKSSSSISGSADRRIRFALLTDSSTLANDGYYYYTTTSDSIVYTVYLNQIFQRWNNNIQPNIGVLLNYIYDASGIDKYVFYGQNYFDASKRPRLKIRYTPRDNPINDEKLNQKQKISNE